MILFNLASIFRYLACNKPQKEGEVKERERESYFSITTTTTTTTNSLRWLAQLNLCHSMKRTQSFYCQFTIIYEYVIVITNNAKLAYYILFECLLIESYHNDKSLLHAKIGRASKLTRR